MQFDGLDVGSSPASPLLLLLLFQDFLCVADAPQLRQRNKSHHSGPFRSLPVPRGGAARWTHSERGGGWFCAKSTHAPVKGSTQPGARDHMRPAVRRLTAVHYHRMRFPAGSTLLRIRALPVPVDKLRCRSPRAVRIGEEGTAGILRSGSKLISAYYLTLPLVAACSCA